MRIALWIVIALFCFVLPAADLTSGGRKHPDAKRLHAHAQHTGLTLTEDVRPAVARLRPVGLSDYLTRGERFGFWFVPVAVILGSIAASIVLARLPALPARNPNPLGGVVAVGVIVTWGIALVALRSVLAAPARSASELELAWDDAERAAGLRQVVNLTIAVACISLLFWLATIGETLVGEGFYRENEAFSWLVTGISLLVFGVLTIVTVAGPMTAWLTGHRKGYEQCQLWPSGVSS